MKKASILLMVVTMVMVKAMAVATTMAAAEAVATGEEMAGDNHSYQHKDLAALSR